MAVTRGDIATAMNKYGTDKVSLHGFDFMYATMLKDIGDDVTPLQSLLEIGVRRGRSLLGWKDVFPNARIEGLEKTLAPDMLEGVAEMTINGDSARSATKQLIAPQYDVIIDDGDHRPDYQWATFLNFEDRWTRAYVIEDVIGHENEAIMRRRFKSRGYTRIKTFGSKLSNGIVRSRGQDEQFQFFGMVIYPKT